MLNKFICGSCSLSKEEQGDDKRSRLCRSKKNPYSSRGLETFSALVADLEEKRQMICSQLGSQKEAPLVRFVYSTSNDCVPIVVRLKDKKKSRSEKVETESCGLKESSKSKSKKREYYLPAAVILILVLLLVCGRSAAVLCTCLGWYIIPTLQGYGQGSKSMKKKEYKRENKSKGQSNPRKGSSAPFLRNWKSFS